MTTPPTAGTTPDRLAAAATEAAPTTGALPTDAALPADAAPATNGTPATDAAPATNGTPAAEGQKAERQKVDQQKAGQQEAEKRKAETTTEAAAEKPAQKRVLQAIALLGGAVTLGWVLAAILAAGHGFDSTDEGYYLLSYRWWSVNGRTFTGVQYLYGPVFEALGYNIAGLRLFRLVTVIFALALFGWAFMRWLRTRRPNASPSRWWEAAGTAAITASGGAVYGWLPLSPGYNDVALLGAFVSAALVLFTAAATERDRDVSIWVPLAAGPVIFAMMLAKWSSSMIVVFAAAVVLLVYLRRRGWRKVLRFIGWTLAGIAASALIVHVAIVPLTSFLPEMAAVNKIVAGKTNSPTSLLAMYWDTTLAVVLRAGRTHAVLLIALLVAVVGRGKWAQRLALVLGVVGLALSAWRVLQSGGVTGGTVNLRNYPATLMLIVLVTLIAAAGVVIRERRSSLATSRPRDWLLLGMLLALPYLHALGTGNAVHVMAVNGFAAWAAVAIAVITGMEGAGRTARLLTAVVTAGCVVVSAGVGIGGLVLHPYRTKGYAVTTAQVSHVAPLSSVSLDRKTAARYTALHDRLAPYLTTGRAMMGFDEMAGIVLMLDGRPVGEAWYSRTDHDRTAAGIKAACESGTPWWGTQEPILLFSRPVGKTEVDALQSCGLDIPSDYRRLAPPEETMGLTVYVPEGEHP